MGLGRVAVYTELRGEVVCGFADCPPRFCLLQLVQCVEDEGGFEEAAIIAGVEAVNEPLVCCCFVEARLGGVFDGVH